MQGEEVTILRECVHESALEVFAACSLGVSPEVEAALTVMGGPPAAEELAAFISFGGELLWGTLTLVGPCAVVKRTCPVPLDGGVCSEGVFDWAGELANQLLGRVKNRLSRRGLALRMSTPKAVHAQHFRVVASPWSTVCALAFVCEGSRPCVYFDAVAPANAVLFPPDAATAECMAEGDALMC